MNIIISGFILQVLRLIITDSCLAVSVSSHVVAAYASFLWETEENEEESTNSDQFHYEGSVTTAQL